MSIPKEDERTPGPVIIPWSYNDEHKLIEDADGNAALTNISSDVGPFIVEACNSFTSLREALAEGRQAAVELASLMREGAHDKEEIKWCRVVDRIDAALNGVTQPASEAGKLSTDEVL